MTDRETRRARLDLLAAKGYLPAGLPPDPPSRPIIEVHGFADEYRFKTPPPAWPTREMMMRKR